MKLPKIKSEDEWLREHKAKIKAKADKVPLETRQKVLDLLRKSKTIGEVCTEVGLDLDTVCEIIDQNIRKVSFMRKEAI